MLNENIKRLRKAKGLSQEELAADLSVVRQTVSKWELGISVPDADMLIKIANALDTKVSILLGENVASDADSDMVKQIAEKLEVLNREYARNKETKRKILRIAFFALGIFCAIGLVELVYVYGSILFAVFAPNATAVSVIGGADGPTAIFVTSKLTGLLMHARLIVPPLAGFIIAIFGIKRTKKD